MGEDYNGVITEKMVVLARHGDLLVMLRWVQLAAETAALPGRASRVQADLGNLAGRLFHYGQGPVFIGKISLVKILGCEMCGTGCESVTVFKLA